MTNLNTNTSQLCINAPIESGFEEVLTEDALAFLEALHLNFEQKRQALLSARADFQQRLDKGETLDFDSQTATIRQSDWKVNPIPQDLQDRRVEITGPTDRKMIINALNSGANTFMADCEDSMAPTWHNVIQGQINLRDAVNGTISLEDTKRGKSYQLNEETAVLMVRPRGWHLDEKHMQVGTMIMSASLVDFGLYFFHNAANLLAKGSGPYFYLPKLEHYTEARLWNEVFVFAQNYLNIPQGTIKATVLVETIMAPFYLDEILFELREHAAGLNCGRWDYIFSFIKKFKDRAGYLFPDRGQVTMTAPFMKAYSDQVIKVCHRRGAHAMGGMAAQIPIKNNPEANAAAIEKVSKDKLREALAGHDGTWVAHPGLVKVAKDVFDEHMPQSNQIHTKPRQDVQVTKEDLLELPKGTITEKGLRQNINVGILYIENWLRGNGAAAIYNLMEDAATAEISRTQVWQWLQAGATLDDDRKITEDLYLQLKKEELQAIREYVGEQAYKEGRFTDAEALFDQLVLQKDYAEFLTLPAYELI